MGPVIVLLLLAASPSAKVQPAPHLSVTAEALRWWPAGTAHLFVKFELTENSLPGTSRKVLFYWRESDSLLVQAGFGWKDPGSAIVVDSQGAMCRRLEEPGAYDWTPCSEVMEDTVIDLASNKKSKVKAHITNDSSPHSFRRHWLAQLALGWFVDRVEASSDNGIDYKVSFANGRPVMAEGTSADGKKRVTVLISYAKPDPSEFPFPIPKLTEGSSQGAK